MKRAYRYLVLDVFTETPLLGNPLAVFLDGAGLSNGEMQALARETNLSETSFCFPGEGKAEDGIPVRIFTTQEELPFAGHPTLGTAAALRMVLPQLRGAAVVRLQLAIGTVPVHFAPGEAEQSDELPFGRPVRGDMEQPLPRFGMRHEPQAVAEALGLPLEALDADKPPQTVSTGVPFTVVTLRSEEVLRSLSLPPQAAADYLRGTDGKFFYVIAPGRDATHWRARMQFYNGEDPATGSAAGAATAYLVHHGFAPAGTELLLEQGREVGRLSLLHTSAVLTPFRSGESDQMWEAGSFVRVGGCTVLVAEGRYFLF